MRADEADRGELIAKSAGHDLKRRTRARIVDTVSIAPRRNEQPAVNAGLTLSLAGFIARLREEAIPASVEHVLRKALVDAVGCGLYGLKSISGRLLFEFGAEQGGPPESTLWAGGGRKVSAINAVLAAGTAVHSFDFDDHSRAEIHPGAVVVPTVLALGERERISGKRLLTAMAAGYETMIRVSLAANPGAARLRGWHLTGTTGTFAAAAAASVILGLDTDTTASALGLAGTQSAGLSAFTADGAMSRQLHAGRAAQNGIMAALLAARGFHGPRYILESEEGGFLKASSDEPRAAEVTRDLGVVWRTAGVRFMPENPMSPEAIDAKFLSLAGAAVGATAAQMLLECLCSAYTLDEIAPVTAALGRVELLE